MKRTVLLVSLLLLSGLSAVWAEPAAAPESADLLKAIFGPEYEPIQVQTLQCAVQARCSNGLYIGCHSYISPDNCEAYRNCVMCDGKVYRCPSGFCPY